MMHIESLSNGLGCQSMLLFVMACRRQIPATVSLTADTGWETDRTWSNGRVSSARTYFDEVVLPFAARHHFDARMVRTRNKIGVPLLGLRDYLSQLANTGKLNCNPLPMFGSKGGRRTQTCTEKFKIRALRQEARRMGAKTNRNAQGIHIGEALRRMSGEFLHMNGHWSIYQTQAAYTVKEYHDGKMIGVKYFRDVKWQTHYYPLVDLKMNRNDCQRAITEIGLPYILSTECDGCPHKDLTRWERTSAPILADLIALEKRFNGSFFFTDKRIPLADAIDAMQRERAADPEKYAVEADFGCQNAICGI